MSLVYISRLEIDNYLQHLLKLNEDERKMRFGFLASNESIKSYTKSIVNDHHLSGYYHDGDVIGAVHVGLFVFNDIRTAELGVSIDLEFRGRGYGRELTDVGIKWAIDVGADKLITQCVSSNAPMKAIARKYGAEFDMDGSETIATIYLKK